MAKKIFILIALLGALVPTLFVLEKAGGLENWHGVPPSGVTDTLYYYARIQEVADGHPLVGNPYIYEYRGDYSPAFFLPDLISALPLLVGIPFNVSIILNVFFWSFVFLFLAYRLLKLLHVGERWAIAWSIFLYIGSYSFMLRPTVMQTIFPLFLFFLVTLIYFLYEPQVKKHTHWLAAASALTFYFYNYLAFIVFLTLASIFLWFLFSKQFKMVRLLVIVGVYTAGLLVPFGVYSFMQMSGPLYAETLARIGLVYTHIPAIEALFFGRWIVVGLSAFALLWYFFPKQESQQSERKIFWIATGCALCMSLMLNVITGVELTLAIHVGRFVMLWMLLLLGVFLHEWYFSYTERNKVAAFWRHGILSILVLLLLMGAVKNMPRALAFFEFDTRGYKIAEMQAYAGPLAWLENNVSEQSVIWTNISIGSYVPILTKHYTLFHIGATLHNISAEELEERYLLWRSLEAVTIDDIKEDLSLYGGSGVSSDQPLAENRRALLCRTVAPYVDMGTCPQKTDAITLRGEEYFTMLAMRYDVVKTHQRDLLEKYKVRYMLIDTRYDNYDTEVPVERAVYADGRFLIFPADAL
jgi:hypothetical protein